MESITNLVFEKIEGFEPEPFPAGAWKDNILIINLIKNLEKFSAVVSRFGVSSYTDLYNFVYEFLRNAENHKLVDAEVLEDLKRVHDFYYPII